MTFLKSRLWASFLFFLCGQPSIWEEQLPPLAGTAYVTSWFGGALWKYEQDIMKVIGACAAIGSIYAYLA